MTTDLEDELRDALAGRAAEVSLPPDLLGRVRAGARARQVRARRTFAVAGVSLGVGAVALAGVRATEHGEVAPAVAGAPSFEIATRPSARALARLPGVEVTALPSGFAAVGGPQVEVASAPLVPAMKAGTKVTSQDFGPGGRPLIPGGSALVVRVTVIGPSPDAAEARALLASLMAQPTDGGMRKETGTVDGLPADLLVNGSNLMLTTRLERDSRYVVVVQTSSPDRAELLRVVAGLRAVP